MQHMQLQTCFYVFVVREIGMRMEMGIRTEMREMGIRMKMREMGIRMEMKEIVMDVAGYVSTMLSLITRTSLAWMTPNKLNLAYIKLENFTLTLNVCQLFFRLRIERSDVLDNNNHLLVTIIYIYQVLHFRLMCLTGELSDVQSNHLIMPPPRR